MKITETEPVILKDRLKDRETMRLIGLAFLLVANLWRWFVHPTPQLGEGLVDPTAGLLFGLSIGCLLMSLRLTRLR